MSAATHEEIANACRSQLSKLCNEVIMIFDGLIEDTKQIETTIKKQQKKNKSIGNRGSSIKGEVSPSRCVISAFAASINRDTTMAYNNLTHSPRSTTFDLSV